jgi:hypothetical protein
MENLFCSLDAVFGGWFSVLLLQVFGHRGGVFFFLYDFPVVCILMSSVILLVRSWV